MFLSFVGSIMPTNRASSLRCRFWLFVAFLVLGGTLVYSNQEKGNLAKRQNSCNELVYLAPSKRCEFIKEYCHASNLGYYLRFVYCKFSFSQRLAFFVLAGWLLSLFIMIGLISSNYFCPNISFLAEALGLSGTTTGVTLLAFGNASPDIFSTFAAVKSGSVSMALCELTGSAIFIVALVTATIGFIAPFSIKKNFLLRDAGFLLGAVILAFTNIMWGKLNLFFGIAMILYYLLFASVVVHHIKTEREQQQNLNQTDVEENFVSKNLTSPIGSEINNDQIETKFIKCSFEYSQEQVSNHDTKEITIDNVSLVEDLFPKFTSFRSATLSSKIHLIVLFVPNLILKLSSPVIHSEKPEAYKPSSASDVYNFNYFKNHTVVYKRSIALMIIQSIVAPFFIGIKLILSNSSFGFWFIIPITIVSILLVTFTIIDSRTYYYNLTLCFIGFLSAIAWIQLSTSEVVRVLQLFGVVLNISEGIIGLTIFAAGNSIGDFVSNLYLAKSGVCEMAMGGVFGGPMLNILFGIGFSAVYYSFKKISKENLEIPRMPLLISSTCGLISLLGLLLMLVPLNKYRINRMLSICLIVLFIGIIVVILGAEYHSKSL